MKRILSVENMRNSDQKTISEGISGRELMFRAGKAIYLTVKWTPPIAIICGSGNNAGDGYVLASLLAKNNIPSKLFLISSKFSSDGEHYFNICKERNIPYEIYTANSDFSSYPTIVDCLFGTGFKGLIRTKEKEAIEKINNSKAYVVSVDINSGLNGNSGMAEVCVKSDLTISIGDYKPGHFLSMAKDNIKKLINVDIGISPAESPYWLFESSDARKTFQARQNFSHKYSYGHSCLIGGSKSFSGAIKLANLGLSSLRSGSGITSLAIPNSIIPSVTPFILESTISPLSDKDGELEYNFAEIDSLLKKVDVIAYGMGLGLGDGNLKTISHILSSNFTGPVIIDADGLGTIAIIGPDILKNATMPVILTPHIGEFSRLSGKSKEKILNDPIGLTREFASYYGVIVLLKGPSTIVTNGSEVILVDKGCPGMATAGSGDVLSGILAGMCSFNKDNLLNTVASAAFVNGLSGELAEKKTNSFSMTARDTVDSIPEAINQILGITENPWNG